MYRLLKVLLGLLLGKYVRFSIAIDLVHPHGIEAWESWAFSDFEIIVPYPLSLTYEIKDSSLTDLILLNTTQLILGTSISNRTTVTKLNRIILGRDSLVACCLAAGGLFSPLGC